MSFVFDKRLDPQQAINHKPSSKAAFGFMGQLDLTGATATAPLIIAKDPSLAAAAAAGAEAQGMVNSVALLTRLRWELGAADPIIIEGLLPIKLKQNIVSLLYTSLTDIGVTFKVKVFEYDPVNTAKKYYACFNAGDTALIGKILKYGDKELAIELSDDEDVSIQDNSFFPFSIKVVPYKENQTITLASDSLAKITKMWGRTKAV